MAFQLAPKSVDSKARRILFVAAIILIALFAFEARGTFAALITRQPVHGGACIKGADGRGYYAWLRSPLIDGDFLFDNEFEAPVNETLPMTATGHRSNPWPVGPAIAWSPAVAIVHLILSSLGDGSPWPADGYSAPYQLAVGFTTLALSLLTLYLTYQIGRQFTGQAAAATASALITLATPVVAYGAVEVCMAHGPATAALALFACIWLRTFGSLQLARWVLVGGLLGLTSLMRWQLSTFLLLPAFEALWLAIRAENQSLRWRAMGCLVVVALSSVVAFTPQLIAKQIVFGHPLGGLHRTEMNCLSPSLWAVLVATDRSLFYWTPITFPAFVGLMHIVWQTRRPTLVVLSAAVIGQIWTVASLLGGEAFLGSAFGFRLLTETSALLVPGIAIMFDGASARRVLWLSIGGAILVAWNLLLLGVYRYHLGLMNGGDLAAMWHCVIRFMLRRPIEVVTIAAAVACLTRSIIVAFENESTSDTDVTAKLSFHRLAS